VAEILLFHPEMNGSDGIGRIDTMMFSLVSLRQGCESIEFVAFGSAGRALISDSIRATAVLWSCSVLMARICIQVFVIDHLFYVDVVVNVGAKPSNRTT
jgi:hypothetical protein